MSKMQHKQQGFTLIEVMVVVVILGILAAILVPKVMDRPDQARKTKARQDIRALEAMVERGLVETGARRVGVEQEMYLVDPQGFARPIALEMMDRLDDPRFQTEVARFNLEANLGVQELGGSFLSDMEHELDDVVAVARRAANELSGDVLLTGILPTLRRSDVTIENLTPEVIDSMLDGLD